MGQDRRRGRAGQPSGSSSERLIEKDMLPATDEADLWIILQSANDIERGRSLERVRRVPGYPRCHVACDLVPIECDRLRRRL
jgi:hypothetical protein